MRQKFRSGFSIRCYGKTQTSFLANPVIKQPIILPAKWAYSGTAKNCNSGRAIYGAPRASLEGKREEYSFIEEKGVLEGAVINKESIGGN